MLLWGGGVVHFLQDSKSQERFNPRDFLPFWRSGVYTINRDFFQGKGFVMLHRCLLLDPVAQKEIVWGKGLDVLTSIYLVWSNPPNRENFGRKCLDILTSMHLLCSNCPKREFWEKGIRYVNIYVFCLIQLPKQRQFWGEGSLYVNYDVSCLIQLSNFERKDLGVLTPMSLA